jgi:hypothetical protein
VSAAREFAGDTYDLVAGEVYGVRCWRFSPMRGLMPRSWHAAPPWTPGVNTARCFAINPSKITDPEGRGRTAAIVTVHNNTMPGTGTIMPSVPTAPPAAVKGLTNFVITWQSSSVALGIRSSQVAVVSWSDGSISTHLTTEFPGVTTCDRSPDERCSCGFYAFTDYRSEELENNYAFSQLDIVTGAIRGFGRTLLGERGFRCEKAEMIAFIKPAGPRQRLETLKRLYPDVPIVPDRDALKAFVSLSKPEDFA